MTLEELKVVARNHGKVRWTKSGDEESVAIDRRGQIVFKSIRSAKWHKVYARGRPIHIDTADSLTFDCVAVDRDKEVL